MWPFKKRTRIPCIDEKCLKYPVCRHLEYVKCDYIQEYVLTTTKKIKEFKVITHPKVQPVAVHNFYNSLWKILHKTWPNATHIETGKYLVRDTIK